MRVNILFLGDAIATHALTRVIDLAEDVLGGNVSSTYNANAYGNGRPVVAQPAPRRRKHGGKGRRVELSGASTHGYVFLLSPAVVLKR